MKLLTPVQVAEILAVSRSTARRMMMEGVLPSVRIRSGQRKTNYRVREEALERWILLNERKSKQQAGGSKQ